MKSFNLSSSSISEIVTLIDQRSSCVVDVTGNQIPKIRPDEYRLDFGVGVEELKENKEALQKYYKTTNFELELNGTKSELDQFYENGEKGEFDRILKCFDHFKQIKSQITKETDAQCITNAWIKYWELISHFSLIEPLSEIFKVQENDGWMTISKKPSKKSRTGEFVVFCNACLPGADILAINHYIMTKTNMKYVWFASSLDPTIEGTLKDEYNLYKNYPDNWLMDKDNNGDVGYSKI